MSGQATSCNLKKSPRSRVPQAASGLLGNSNLTLHPPPQPTLLASDQKPENREPEPEPCTVSSSLTLTHQVSPQVCDRAVGSESYRFASSHPSYRCHRITSRPDLCAPHHQSINKTETTKKTPHLRYKPPSATRNKQPITRHCDRDLKRCTSFIASCWDGHLVFLCVECDLKSDDDNLGKHNVGRGRLLCAQEPRPVVVLHARPHCGSCTTWTVRPWPRPDQPQPAIHLFLPTSLLQ